MYTSLNIARKTAEYLHYFTDNRHSDGPSDISCKWRICMEYQYHLQNNNHILRQNLSQLFYISAETHVQFIITCVTQSI